MPYVPPKPPNRARRAVIGALAAAPAAGLLAAAPPGAAQPVAPTPGLVLDVPFAPTSFTVIDTMLRVANVVPQDYVVDLGSGDGRIGIAAARDWGASGFGVELDPALLRDSNEFAAAAGVADRMRFFQQDLFTADLSKATVVTLYLGQKVNLRVRPKLLAELRPGARIVSHDFDLGDWRPDLTIRIREYGSTVHFWWVPARIAGLWHTQWKLPGRVTRDYRFDLRQNYQEIAAAVRTDGVKVALRDVRLAGERLTFLLMEEQDRVFTFRRCRARVRGDVIEGSFRNETAGERAETPFRMVRTQLAEAGPPGAWTFPATTR
jgi:SAM-dependent methyltransferase